MSDLPDEVKAGARTLKLREITPGKMLDLIEAAAAASSSGAWLQYASAVCTVCEIDGVPQPFPTTKAMVKALADKVGNDGMIAVTLAMHPPQSDDSESPSEDEATKN